VPADVFFCPPDGAPLGSERDAVDLIGEAADADWVAIPAARLDPAFFALSNGMAGAFLQKFVTYGLRVAIVGDIGAHTAASGALRDFVRESNAGERIWFVPSAEALTARLAGPRGDGRL
jgi:hypothetical protein